MTAKVLYDKRGEVAYITLNRPEVKNAIDIEAHELMCDYWRDFRDDPALRVAVITGTGDAFTAGADLKTHAPEWQTVGSMVGRERLEDGLVRDHPRTAVAYQEAHRRRDQRLVRRARC